MPQTAASHAPLARPQSRPRTHLRLVPPPAPRRCPSAPAVVAYALGLAAGFLLAAGASLPGGAAIASGQLALAALAGAAALLAAMRARAVARSRRVTRRALAR
jgi:hypothetical protein